MSESRHPFLPSSPVMQVQALAPSRIPLLRISIHLFPLFALCLQIQAQRSPSRRRKLPLLRVVAESRTSHHLPCQRLWTALTSRILSYHIPYPLCHHHWPHLSLKALPPHPQEMPLQLRQYSLFQSRRSVTDRSVCLVRLRLTMALISLMVPRAGFALCAGES